MKKRAIFLSLFFLSAHPQEGRPFFLPGWDSSVVAPVFFGLYSFARSLWGNRHAGKSWKESLVRSIVSGSISSATQGAVFLLDNRFRYMPFLPFLIWSIVPKDENRMLKYFVNDFPLVLLTPYFFTIPVASWFAGDPMKKGIFYQWVADNFVSYFPQLAIEEKEDDFSILPLPLPIIEEKKAPYVKPVVAPAVHSVVEVIPEKKESQQKIVPPVRGHKNDMLKAEKEKFYYEKKRKRKRIFDRLKKKNDAKEDAQNGSRKDVKKDDETSKVNPKKDVQKKHSRHAVKNPKSMKKAFARKKKLTPSD